MDLTITYGTFFKNLKFWGFHSLINSTPSFILAYLHDWNTLESFIAMGLGILLFAFMLTFFMSMKDVNRICTTGFMSRAIKAGIYFRLFLFVMGLPAIISFIVYFIGGIGSLNSFSDFKGMVWAPDLISGIISHAFYHSLRDIIPIRGIHDFTPTIIITLLQGVLIMGMLIVAGIILAALGSGIRNGKTKQPIAE